MSQTQNLFRQGFEDHVYSGAAIAVGKKDRILYKETIGNVSYDPDAASVDADTLFDMASVTKILGTTFCAFHMIEEGTLSLLDSLTDFFDDVPEDKKNITIRHLMTHTSGLPPEIFLWKECQSPEDAVTTILNAPLIYETGKGVAYSCMGYILLGKIIEKIKGEGLDVLSRRWTFEPLGMERTGYRPVDQFEPDKTICYTEVQSLNGPTPPGVVHDENARFLNGVSGNAGIFSSLNDMIRFCRMLAMDGYPLITKRQLNLATINYTPGLDENRGLGFQMSGPEPTFFGDLFGDRGFGHTGFTGTSFTVDPESGLYIILLTNRVHPTRANGKLTRLRHLIQNAAMAEFLGA